MYTKTKYLVVLLLILSCSKMSTNNEESSSLKIIPDNTPFITGLLEATNDTVHHYPEVVVGYVSDGSFDPSYVEVQNIEDLYNPTLWTQVVRTLQRFKLDFREETQARVFVKGPLDHPLEKVVEFNYERGGVYGDENSELKLLSGGNYSLRVELIDGSIYVKETIIPKTIKLDIKDTLRLNVKYKPYQDGTPKEESDPHEYVYYGFPENTFITEIQSNNSSDREYLELDPSEDFLFHDRSEYLRNGSLYGIITPENDRDSLRKGWWRDLNVSWVKEKKYDIDRMRFSYFSDGIWSNFQNSNNWYTIKGKKMKEMYSRFEDALTSRDSTYLFDVSTIEKLGENGEVLPKSENDAIGFFAGYFSVYKKAVLVPVRNFDLDSVLTAQDY